VTGGVLVVNSFAIALVTLVIAGVTETHTRGSAFQLLILILGAFLGSIAALGANGAL